MIVANKILSQQGGCMDILLSLRVHRVNEGELILQPIYQPLKSLNFYIFYTTPKNLVFEHFEPLNIVTIKEGRSSHYNPPLTDLEDPILVQVGVFSYVYSKAGVYY